MPPSPPAHFSAAAIASAALPKSSSGVPFNIAFNLDSVTVNPSARPLFTTPAFSPSALSAFYLSSTSSSPSPRLRTPSPRSNERLGLVLSPLHHAWLASMGAEHYYGYASHQKALRDLLLWAEAAEPDDVAWIFTTNDDRIIPSSPSTTCGCGNISTFLPPPSETLRHPSTPTPSPSSSMDDIPIALLLPSPTLPPVAPNGPKTPNVSPSSSADFLPEPIVPPLHFLPPSLSEPSSPSPPVLVYARLPRHVCDWLRATADHYTDGDISAALGRLCCVAKALDVPHDIFNVRDDELLLASSADIYAMIGRESSLGTPRSQATDTGGE